jgi:hypothetical protein
MGDSGKSFIFPLLEKVETNGEGFVPNRLFVCLGDFPQFLVPFYFYRARIIEIKKIRFFAFIRIGPSLSYPPFAGY